MPTALLFGSEDRRFIHSIRDCLAAFPESQCESESVADWPLGRRNCALAQLRCACFGRWLRGWTACEQCGERLEFEVDGNALAASNVGNIDESIEVQGDVFRLPTTRDLARIAGEHGQSVAAVHLMEQCMISNTSQHLGARRLDEQKWTEEELDAIGERMAQADPLAEILLHFECPVCSHAFDLCLDLAAFLWSELEGCGDALKCLPRARASAPRNSGRKDRSFFYMGRSCAARDAETDPAAAGLAVAPQDDHLRSVGIRS